MIFLQASAGYGLAILGLLLFICGGGAAVWHIASYYEHEENREDPGSGS